MSTAAGLAAVTAVLKDLLSNGLIDRDVVGAVGDVVVTTQAPDRIALPEETSQLNLFLHGVSRNTGWSNEGLPTRDARGDLVGGPPLALDLHYLLSAYGAKELHAELLLGYAMQLMHEMPVLTRPAIRDALTPLLQVDDGAVPAGLRDLFTSGLADQIEQLKVCQRFPSTEEMSNLWMSFSAPYRPTAAYDVSVLLIESARGGRGAPPVRAVTVGAGTLRRPVIEEVRAGPAAGGGSGPIHSGGDIVLVGRRLLGDRTSVVIGPVEVTAGLAVTDTRITLPVPAALRAGVHAVHVVHRILIGQPAAPHRGVESDAVPVVLTPAVTAATAALDAGSSGASPRRGTVTVDVTPPVGRDQRVTLLLNERGAPDPAVRPGLAYRFACPARNRPADPPESSTVAIPFLDVLPATYLVRVRVDGAESRLGVAAGGTYDSPALVIP